ncbi:hypothetical protein WHJ69_14535, partial [Staphylococcus aureus]|uniref:hypothetical protein n=1 Tax=Staphylococcus aureus TaxID=1280 RepID=UPI0039BEB227
MLAKDSLRILLKMIQKPKNFFKAVNDLEKRKKLLLEMTKASPIVLCKAKNQSVFFLEFVRVDGLQKLTFKSVPVDSK